MQRELRSLQSEIVTLSAQAQALLSGTSVQSHGLIQESLTSLTQRVGMLESQAAAHSTELHQSQLLWQQYHEDVRSLRSSMQELQTSVVVPHTGSSANLDSLVSDVHVSFLVTETAVSACILSFNIFFLKWNTPINTYYNNGNNKKKEESHRFLPYDQTLYTSHYQTNVSNAQKFAEEEF